MKNLIEVGKVGRKVGLKGFCKLHLSSDFPEFLTKNRTLIAKRGDLTESLIVDEFNQNRSEIKFVGINSPEEASLLTHTELFTTIDETKEAIKLGDDELFWFDLIGVDAYEGDKYIGKIVSIDDSVELFITIKIDDSFSSKQRDLIIPWSEHFVLEATKEKVLLAHVLKIIDAL